jgi:anti-sigma factor RsiW
MAEILCGYTADRDETLTAYLYDDIDPAQRAAFEAHIATCERCRNELAELERVRERLQQWATPGFRPPVTIDANALVDREPSPRANNIWSTLSEIPMWVQVAAACLFLGVSAGFANLDVRYDAGGLTVRTGWSRSPVRTAAEPAAAGTGAAVAPASAPWRADLDQLERRLKSEWSAPTPITVSTPASDAQLLRQVRALIAESEKKQQNDVALRIAEVVRNFDARRGADLATIYGGLGAIQTNTRFEVAKQRQWLTDYLTQVSTRR